SLSAQVARGSHQPSYYLMQLSVDGDSVSQRDFAAKTETIKSCGDARKVGKEVGADIKRNRFVASWNLNPSMQKMLDGMDTGEASEIVTNDGKTMRVFVICSRGN
ncbi:MAG: hypothetical protein AAGK01_02850, partial [Pseudomonadota bacterium]